MSDEEFRELFTKYYHSVFRTAYHVLHDLDLAEDICQETFLEVLRSGSKIKEGQYKVWLILCAHSKAVDFCRRSYQKHEIATGDFYLPEEKEKDHMVEMLIRKEETDSLIQNIREKNPVWCELLIRTYFIRESDQEIANALGITIGNVRTKRHRMLKWLRITFASGLY